MERTANSLDDVVIRAAMAPAAGEVVDLAHAVARVRQVTDTIRANVERVIVGKAAVIDLLLVALLSEGHTLIEDVPGMGKTMMARSLARSISSAFARIQGTADLLPGDITGISYFNQKTGDWEFRKGAVFANILLVDEINRIAPRTQSALLEAMEERQVTLDGHSEPLPELFMVVATQNPIEFEGTYPLPEAQLDRFMLKIIIGYPDRDAERLMLGNWNSGQYRSRAASQELAGSAVVSPKDILACRNCLGDVKVEESLFDYLMKLVEKTRQLSDIQLGASPRAAVYWLAAAKAHAAMSGRDFVTPDNIKFVAHAVLRHRLILTPDCELEGINTDQVVDKVLNLVAVPR